jgi:carboxyl-terminal processing protease
MMKQAPGARLIGERTMGASGNPQPIQLANGVTVFIPSWQAVFPDGSPLEGRGIPPDVEVDSRGGDFSKSDPVLQRAVEWFGEK